MRLLTLLLTTWQWQPTVVIGCVALIAAYKTFVHTRTPQVWLYVTGVLLLLVALVSPLDTLGDQYLLSVHMLQHLLLIGVIPPLLLLGIPAGDGARLLAWAPARQVERAVGHPVIAWVLGIGTLWIWHLPVLFDAALLSEPTHILEHLTFLTTSVIFWWQIVAPVEDCRLRAPAAALYLFAAYIASSVLGVLLTFAPAAVYWPYQHPIDTLQILPLVRDTWGVTPAIDQQVGGLLMWVVGGMPYFATTWVLMTRWFMGDDLATDGAPPPPRPYPFTRP